MNWSKWILVIDIQKFRRFHFEELDPIMVSKVWVGMSTNKMHLLQFKIQGHLQNEDFECRSIKTHFEENSLKFVLLFQSSFCLFSYLSKNCTKPAQAFWSKTRIPLDVPTLLVSTVLWSLLIRYEMKWKTKANKL